jgi:hypothetical protein
MLRFLTDFSTSSCNVRSKSVLAIMPTTWIRPLPVNQYQSGYVSEIDIVECTDAEIVYGEKVAECFLSTSGDNELCVGIEFAYSHYGSMAVEIRMAMRGDDIHDCILTGSSDTGNAV